MSPDVWVASARKAESFLSSSHPLSRVHGELILGHPTGRSSLMYMSHFS